MHSVPGEASYGFLEGYSQEATGPLGSGAPGNLGFIMEALELSYLATLEILFL